MGKNSRNCGLENLVRIDGGEKVLGTGLREVIDLEEEFGPAR